MPHAVQYGEVSRTAKETLRRLAIHDDAYLESVLARGFHDTSASGLNAKTQALVRIGGLVAVDAPTSAYLGAVEAALAAGTSVDEIIGVVVALLPSIGADRVVSATPGVALALGYDLEQALERLEEG